MTCCLKIRRRPTRWATRPWKRWPRAARAGSSSLPRRLHPDYDAGAPLHASMVPAAFPLEAEPRRDPRVAMLLPYGESMARFSAIANVTRNEDGVLRDIPLRETAGDWALPSLPLRLATTAMSPAPDGTLATVRPNWRKDTRLPHVSAADLLTGKAVCRDAAEGVPALNGRVALVGYTASGLNDAKPTSVDPVMPGVEVLAEATEALVAGSAIRTPPAWLKYVLATFLVLLTTFAFYRGEPANDIDSVFVASNLALLSAAFVGITFFGFFFDIFASIGFREPGFRILSRLCRVAARPRCRQRRFPAGVRSARGSLAGRCAPAVRARCRARRGAGGATATRIPPTIASLPVCGQRRRDAGGRRRAQELVARRVERPDGPGVARRNPGGGTCRSHA